MSKIRPIEKHIAAIKAGEVSKTNVIGIRKALNALARTNHNWSNGRTCPHITNDEAVTVSDLLTSLKPRVYGELHDTGKTLLQNKRYRRQLESVAHIIADIESFRLIGYEEMGRYGEYNVPVYRAYDSQGNSFPFYVIPWQSGGKGPEIAESYRW